MVPTLNNGEDDDIKIEIISAKAEGDKSPESLLSKNLKDLFSVSLIRGSRIPEERFWRDFAPAVIGYAWELENQIARQDKEQYEEAVRQQDEAAIQQAKLIKQLTEAVKKKDYSRYRRNIFLANLLNKAIRARERERERETMAGAMAHGPGETSPEEINLIRSREVQGQIVIRYRSGKVTFEVGARPEDTPLQPDETLLRLTLNIPQAVREILTGIEQYIEIDENYRNDEEFWLAIYGFFVNHNYDRADNWIGWKKMLTLAARRLKKREVPVMDISDPIDPSHKFKVKFNLEAIQKLAERETNL